MSEAIVIAAVILGVAWVIVTMLKQGFEFRVDFKDDDR